MGFRFELRIFLIFFDFFDFFFVFLIFFDFFFWELFFLFFQITIGKVVLGSRFELRSPWVVDSS